jgi:superfamily I DNA/RNA helicase
LSSGPDQAIYSFRGADSRCFERLETMNRNYTHPPERVLSFRASIVSAALHVIAQNEGPERELTPTKQSNRAVRLVTAQGELSEDIFAAKEINRLIGGIDMLDAGNHMGNREGEETRSFGDIAILYRNHSQEERLEECFRRRNPYIVAG